MNDGASNEVLSLREQALRAYLEDADVHKAVLAYDLVAEKAEEAGVGAEGAMDLADEAYVRALQVAARAAFRWAEEWRTDG